MYRSIHGHLKVVSTISWNNFPKPDLDFHLKQINLYDVVQDAFNNNPQRYILLNNHFNDFRNEFYEYRLKLESLEHFYAKNSEEI